MANNKFWRMIWGIAIFFATLIGKLLLDIKQYHSRKTINHALEAVFVTIALLVASYLAGWISAPMWFFGFTCLFDPAFALLMGQRPFYLGTTAKLDLLQRKYPFLQVLKYVIFLLSIILFIWLR